MPSDFYQTKAMAHLIQKSGRNWIGILTTDDDYGLSTLLQFSSAQLLSHLLPLHHHLPEITQTHVHRVGDAIQPSHPLSSPSPPTSNPCQHQSLFQWVNPSHEVAKVLEKVLAKVFSFSISPSNENPGLISFAVETAANNVLSQSSSQIMPSNYWYFWSGSIRHLRES